MNNIEVGQVLNMKIRFNNRGLISERKHPYLVVNVDYDMGVIEVAQIDSLEGKEWKATKQTNKTIFNDNPIETVIDKDSFVQLDNCIKLENYDGIIKYRRQTNKLSSIKLTDILNAYYDYHDKNEIDENKQVYIDSSELEAINQSRLNMTVISG